MAMSTMLHHENPPLRNKAPVDLATTSPMPGRNGKMRCTHVVVIDEEIHSSLPQQQYTTKVPNISQLPCHLLLPPPRSVSSMLAANPLVACSGVLGSMRECQRKLWLPRAVLFCYLLRLPTLLPTLILSSPYRLIQKVNTQTQKCLPLSPPTSPSPSAAPRSSLAMSTAPSPCPSLLSVT
jgi:hypothetical protein